MGLCVRREGIVRVVIPSLSAFVLFVIALFFVILPTFREAIMERKKEMIRELVHTEWNILAIMEQQERSGKLTREEAQSFVKEEIQNQHYGSDGTDYFWINDMSPGMVVHPFRPDLNGQDLNEYQDPEGKYLFVDMVEIVKNQGEGFVEYKWQGKDDPTRIESKMSFVRGFEPWGWIVGTGVYLEDVRLEIQAISRHLIVISGGILGLVSFLSFFIMRQGLLAEERRHQAEKALQEYQGHLEQLVEIRTAELSDTNELLQKEIVEGEFAKEIIKNSYAELDQIFNSACDGMLVIDLEFNIMRANRTFVDLVGAKVENIVATKCFSSCQSASCHTSECPLTRVISGEGQIEMEVEKKRQNGKGIFCILTATPYKDSDGKLIGILLDFKDITYRKQAEEALRESEKRYRTVFESANDAIFTMKDLRFIECNPKTMEVFGCMADELLGQTPLDFSPEFQPDGMNSKEKALGKIDAAMAGDPQVFEWRHKRCDGTFFDAEISLSCLELSRQFFLQGIARDVTKRKVMEKELCKAHKLDSIGVLAGGIAHDFNNLLTVIMGNVSLVKTCVAADDKTYALLENTEKASLQAVRLTQQLLTFAKGGTPVKKNVSISDLIEDSIHFSLSGSSYNCECHLPKNIWRVTVDDGQIRQVLQNLIINATQAMPEAGAIIISARNHVVKKSAGLPLKEGKYVKISVEDHGIGIKKEDIQNIFDPFYSTKDEGSGLGLAVSYSIMNKHDGLITVESEVGKGTIFDLYLPALPATHQERIKEEEKKKVLHRGKGKILVMDDECFIRELVKAILEKLGYAHELAKDGQEAIKLYEKAFAEKQPFDLVIMDLTIKGGMGGKEAIERLLAFDPKVKAIVSSGYSNDPIMTNFQEYGFCGVMAKPYCISELSQTFERVLGSEVVM